jgi:hypothetical protein
MDGAAHEARSAPLLAVDARAAEVRFAMLAEPLAGGAARLKVLDSV